VVKIHSKQNQNQITFYLFNNYTRSKGPVPFDNTIETIVLLDVSGSMGQNVRRIITEYLPEALVRLAPHRLLRRCATLLNVATEAGRLFL
jgi:hypothetical protein